VAHIIYNDEAKYDKNEKNENELSCKSEGKIGNNKKRAERGLEERVGSRNSCMARATTTEKDEPLKDRH
jgi:hypothetical protein